jgi:hypothetical protein
MDNAAVKNKHRKTTKITPDVFIVHPSFFWDSSFQDWRSF